MPTDIIASIKRRQTQRLRSAHEETFLLIVPVVFGLLTMVLSIRSPAFAAVVICVGLQ